MFYYEYYELLELFDLIGLWFFVVLVFILLVALLPTIIAVRKNHPYKIPIILINIFGGLLWGVGWVIALVWCFILPRDRSNGSINVANEIQIMHELMEKGVLTQDEFELKKRALLKV
ncbi:superinfection immunity protein [Desulfonatronum sp. SC1]|uniref:superinfection immunity protein n=1 Tax=Desulfonatronum sp. SC1 TaxID=2109626 RepID=UPI000D2F50A3|nr:superinfection immunity protein [Desulfonatronum sp. SC1]PTN36837.1 hypothetical protein C6366_08175 [Desulfonatronum sp. SC1]